MMYWLRGAMATAQFEFLRSLTYHRVAVSLGLALFPGVMMLLLIAGPRLVGGNPAIVMGTIEAFSTFGIVLLVSLVCLLSLLLWAPANIYTELEGKSWGYIASRPGGRIGSFVGKFLTAVLVSFLVSVIAISVSLMVVDRFATVRDPIQKWLALTGIYLIACLVYGAIFSMLGTIFYKRAMVVAAGYLIVSEVVLAIVPALVNKFTMRFHLQTLGISWLGWFVPDSEKEYLQIYGTPWPDWLCLTILGSTCVFALLAGAIVVTSRQYAMADES